MRRAVILMAAILTGLAVAVTCALCINRPSNSIEVDNVSGAVGESTTYTDVTGNYSAPGKLKAGDILVFNYKGSAQSITLPRGSFKIEVWGAAGGGADPGYGGYGGFMSGTAKFTSTVTLTVTVGQGGVYQNGTQSVGTRAYGGGGGGFGYGGGGGGGTYIDIGSTPVIIAGGGGGAADDCGQGTIMNGSSPVTVSKTYAVGNGGYPNGGNGGTLSGSGATATGTPTATGNNGAGAYGGSQSGGGAGNGTSSSYKGTNGASRQGGDGNKGSTNSGGGGGGGYFGGGGGGGDTSAGGGGSSYYNPTYVSGYSTTAPSDIPIKCGRIYNASTSGHSTGENGYARITVISVNQAPTTRSATVTTKKRGDTATVTAYAYTIAQDPDYANTTGATANSVYFTNGTSSNFDTFTTTANTGLFINSACTTVATKYFDWTWNSSQQFTINKVKCYPRNGIDGSPANGKLTLYARVRDTFGTNTTRGTSIVSFTVVVPANTVSAKSGTVSTSAGNYYLGTPNTTTAPTGNPTASTIYNPNGNYHTAIIGKSLPINEPFTIKASELLNGDINGALYSGDMAVMQIADTSKILSSVTTRKYKVDELDAGSTVTAYNSSAAAIGNTFSQLTFRCITPDPAWQVLTLNVYVVEKTTAWGTSKPNVAPNINPIRIDVVFKMENSRPYLKAADTVIDLNVGETKALTLPTYFNDIDGISSATHTILGAVVPANEFIQLDNHGNLLGTNATGYNIGSVVSDTFSTSAQGNTATGFNMSIAYNVNTASAGSNSDSAFMRYSYSGDTLTVIGLRPSFSQYASSRANKLGHFYLLIHIRDARDLNDNGIWLPIAFRVGYNTSYAPVATVTAPNTLTSQTAVSTFPTASGSKGDEFYFAPMAVNYNGSHVIGKRKATNADGSVSIVSDGVQALAIDGDNFATESGIASWGAKLNEFLQLATTTTPESIVKSISSDNFVKNADGSVAENTFVKAELVDLYIEQTALTAAYFNNGRIVVGARPTGTDATDGYKFITLGSETVNGTAYYVYKGIKLTLKASTMNRYFYASADVTDSTGKTVNGISIAVRVNNTSPEPVKDASRVATFGMDYESARSFYEYDPDNADFTKRVTTPTVTYKIPLGAKFVVTPYDFVTDYNISNALGSVMTPASGFTLNGITGRFDPATGVLTTDTTASTGSVPFEGLFDKTRYGIDSYIGMLGGINSASNVASVSATASGTASDSAKLANQRVPNDKLFFARTVNSSDAYTYNPTSFNDVAVSTTGTSGFLTYAFGNTVQAGGTSYSLDYIVITATTRTAQPAIIELTVRDRFGDTSDCDASFVVRIKIDVVNTAPSVKDVNRYEEIAVSPVNSDGDVKLSTVVFAANGNGGASGLMTDLDNDICDFIPSMGVLLANTDALLGDRAVTSFDYVTANYPQYLTDDGTAGGRPLTEYMTAGIVSRTELSVTAKSSTKHLENGVFVYFFVSDGNGGTSLGFVKVEVVNSVPVINGDTEGGFADPLWSVESTSLADITRNRYIVGSASAATELKQHAAAVDADIRLIATDYDALHNHVTLAPRYESSSVSTSYVNLAVPAGTAEPITRDAFENAVPDVVLGTSFSTAGRAAAVAVCTEVRVGESVTYEASLPEGYVAELMFFDGEAWITRTALIDRLAGKTISSADVAMFFDGDGRFIFKDWALRLRAARGMTNGTRVDIVLSVRDETALGGDTAGKDTAYASDRRDGNAVVNGAIKTSVYQYIADTGIRTKDEYGIYDNYYVVEHVDEASAVTAYVSTYDGNTDSVYATGDNVQSITYDVVEGDTGGERKELRFDGTGANSIKTRTAGGADNTLAGTDSGAKYDDVKSTLDKNTGAYKYPSVIEIPTDTTADDKAVYVPMSFFGLLQNMTAIADDGTISFLGDYVGYNINDKSATFDRNNIADITKAIKLTDGVSTWTGNGDEGLNSNPYITIGTFDFYKKEADRAAIFGDAYSKPYYNNRLAMLTVNDKDELTNVVENSANFKNFVGDGRVIYLEGQEENLQEHNFGLTFSKKNQRTAVRNLTLTIELAKSNGSRNTDEKDSERRSVSVDIHVENAKFELSVNNGEDDESVLKFDEEKGTYYADITMESASSQAFMLVRRTGANTVEDGNSAYSSAKRIAYTDSDYDDKKPDTYRDSAYFYSDSFASVGSWMAGESAVKRVKALSDDNKSFVNVNASNASAQRSMANYFGASIADNGVITLGDGDSATYQPNGGIYGTNSNNNAGGIEGYSSYFNASLSDSGRVLNIMSSHKTAINKLAFELGKVVLKDGTVLDEHATREQVTKAYAERGLVAEYMSGDSDLEPSRVYYPFKVLAYDNCGAGFTDGAYNAIEFRITVVNAAPTLKSVGEESLAGDKGDREYRLNLAVGNSITFNLYDFVSDPDIYVRGSNGYYSLATEAQFESSTGIDIETGDYLDSPFKHDPYINGEISDYDADNVVQKPDGTFYRNGGGFTRYGDNTRDVVMWMETQGESGKLTASSVPSANYITFTVNRRTAAMTTVNGVERSISLNEYRFELRFYDGEQRSTQKITFIITVTNQTPRVTAVARYFTMRAGDDLTVLTTYYDKFIGGEAGGSAAYKNSETGVDIAGGKKGYFAQYRAEHENDGRHNAVSAADGASLGEGYWLYEDITSTAYPSVVTDSNTDRVSASSLHLGYLALADDDTPWRLRIASIKYDTSVSRKLWVDRSFELTGEGAETGESFIAIRVRADRACVNEPLELTLTDGEGGVVLCTLYFTIISSPPVALDYSNDGYKQSITEAGLELVEDDGAYGEFRLFTVPGVDAEYEVSGFEDVKSARKVYRIPMQSVARDPDGADETYNMSLFNNGSFEVNGVPLIISSDGVYRSEYFELTVEPGGRAFTLTATGYNPNTSTGYEELRFLIADAGNPIYDNTLEIKLRVYTLYSDMTNPTAAGKSDTDYKAYLAGSEKINVKSYDAFYGATVAEQSVLAHIALTGSSGNDGNTVSPIVDPDVKVKGGANYTVRMYALMDADDRGTFNALSADKLAGMFVRDPAANTFYLDKDLSDIDDYFIGGLQYDGVPIEIASGAASRLQEVNKYIDFSFESGGARVMFTPVASTLNNEHVLLYIEAEKYLGASRQRGRADSVLVAGALFRLNVEDSAPQTVTDSGVPSGADWAVSGAKGDTLRLKIFDARNPFGAMFTDSDVGDLVSINDFDDAAYTAAVAKAVAAEPSLDWAAKDGKPRAFTVNIDRANNMLEITINRRMDKLSDGKYLPSVSFPIEFTGADKTGKTAKAVVMLTVNNTGVTVDDDVFVNDIDPITGVGYTFCEQADGSYVIDARIKYSTPLTIELDDIIKDIDRSDADTDSFVFAGSSESVFPYEYLTDKIQTVYWFDTLPDGTPDHDTKREFATVEPIGEDKWHQTGFKITAINTTRTLSARTYVRVLDRASDSEERDTGVYIVLNITVMNDAPYVIEGKNAPTIYMFGTDSDTVSPKGKLFFIGDFIADNNESDVTGDAASSASDTYLRIFSQQPSIDNLKLYSTKIGQIDGLDNTVDSSALFVVDIPSQIPEDLLEEYRKEHEGAAIGKDSSNRYNQWFIITPLAGFYGSGGVDINVVDGDSSSTPDSLTATFRINVQVLYDPNETANELQPMDIACCKTENIDIGMLMPEFDNKLDLGESDADHDYTDEKFSQSEFYRLTDVRFQNAEDSEFATLERIGDSSVWRITAGKQTTLDPIRVNVKYVLSSDPTKEYSKFFWLTVVPNKAPTLRYTSVTFVRYDRTGDQLRDLDDTNTVRIEAWQLFQDEDDPEGAALRMLDVKSQVTSLVTASLSEDKRFLIINFVARGQSEITVTVTDETGTAIPLTFTAINEDLPNGSLWLRIKASFESNMVVWIIVVCAILLLLILLIILIAVLRKRKRTREEIEALIVSEMEIEDQMLKLAGGPAPTDYRSYGYLPPTPDQPPVSPDAMLGAGTEAPSDVAALPPGEDSGTEPPPEGV